jgi:hypothetical protein
LTASTLTVISTVSPTIGPPPDSTGVVTGDEDDASSELGWTPFSELPGGSLVERLDHRGAGKGLGVEIGRQAVTEDFLGLEGTASDHSL